MKTHKNELLHLERSDKFLTLAERRMERGLRQVDVAKKLDVDQGTVSNWERGTTKPQSKYRRKLAKLYGCTVDDLLKEE